MTLKRVIIKSTGQSPVCLLALGLSPLMMKSGTLLSALIMGTSFGLIFILAGLSVSALRKLIPQQSRLVFIFIITATWTTLVDLLLQTWFYEMRLVLEIYIPVIAMNSLLILGMEKEALQLPVLKVLGIHLSTALLVILICVVTGLIRECLAQGVVFSDIEMLFPAVKGPGLQFLPDTLNLPIFKEVPGAFIVLGCIIAFVNVLVQKSERPERQSPAYPLA